MKVMMGWGWSDGRKSRRQKEERKHRELRRWVEREDGKSIAWNEKWIERQSRERKEEREEIIWR